jgi:hypothetical protein
MIKIGGVVNQPSNISFSDGDESEIMLGKTAEQMVAQQHESLYALTSRGRMFHGCSITPSAIPIKTTTSPTFILWNPRSSNFNVVLVEYAVGWASGTNVEGNIQLGLKRDVPSTVYAGAHISAFTDATILNGVLTDGKPPHARFGIAATIIAATVFYPLGMNIMVLDVTKATPVDLKYRFYGTLILPPGSAAFSCSSAATVATYNERITWYEYPI